MQNTKIKFLTILLIIGLIGCTKDSQKDPEVVESVTLQDGTIEHPYLIRTKQDLIQMRDKINNENSIYASKVYKLIADIDMTGEHNWIPIGLSDKNPFQGIFDGNGKIIKNIKIGNDGTTVDIKYAGIFGYVTGSDIKNLGVQWTRITSSSYAGGIAAYVSGSTIKDCNSTGEISSSVCGGIIGSSETSNILNCYTVGAISGVTVGGIIGESNNSNIKGCYSTGNISGNTIGGIAGYSKGTISDCYSTGKILGKGNSGGIAGQGLNIVNCFSTGDITGKSCVGGIAGIAFSIVNCYSKGIIKSTDSSCCQGTSVGGISGHAPEYNAESSYIINCYSTGSVISSSITDSGDYAGGIIGIAYSSSVINCYSSAIVSSTSSYISIAGGIASSCNGKILNCYSSGDISSMSLSPMGSFNYSGDVVNNSSAGGILGRSSYYDTVIRNCLALSNSLIAVCGLSSNYSFIGRICPNSYPTASNNFASPTMVIKKGKSESNLTTVTNFSDIKSNGSNLTGIPVNLLNQYVTANPTYEGISLLKWKVQAGVNNGLPVFDK